MSIILDDKFRKFTFGITIQQNNDFTKMLSESMGVLS